jgi:hypothetical protein
MIIKMREITILSQMVGIPAKLRNDNNIPVAL